MKKISLMIALLISPLFFLGFYQTRWIEDDQLKFFIKKRLTYKISFINVFRSDHEDNWNGYLETEERQYAIDFCKYYVGFDTPINTMDDFHKCKQIYELTETHDSPVSVRI
jgi:hypothetical protein